LGTNIGRFRTNNPTTGRKWLDEKRGLFIKFRPALGNSKKVVAIVGSERAPDSGPGENSVECLICGICLSQLSRHINYIHGINGEEYHRRFGSDKKLVSPRLLARTTERFRKQGDKLHQKHRYRICLNCGEQFEREKNTHKNDYCGKDCMVAGQSKLRRSDSKYKEIAIQNSQSEKRKTYLERVKGEKLARQTHICVVCEEKVSPRAAQTRCRSLF